MQKLTFKKLLLLPIKLILLGIGSIGVLCLTILRPLVFVRIGLLVHTRIGEYGTTSELYLRERASRGLPKREVHIFISGMSAANDQLMTMISRKMLVIKVLDVVRWVMTRLKSMFPKSKVWLPPMHEVMNFRQFYSDYNVAGPQLEFIAQEEERGKALLQSLGIEQGKPFVCLHVRDKAYLDKVHPYFPREEWSYHDFRDADIDTYIPTVNYLASLGIFTIRMGYMVEKKFEVNNPYVIDYASHYRSDFGDIYLSAKCKFFIGSEGGLICVPWMFTTPVAYTNRVPVTIGGRHKSNVYITKKLWWKEKKRFMTFREVYESEANIWYTTQDYQAHHVEVVDNTPEEILGLVKEMNMRLDGQWIATDEERELQDRYLSALPEDIKACKDIPRMSTEFLRLNQELLELTRVGVNS